MRVLHLLAGKSCIRCGKECRVGNQGAWDPVHCGFGYGFGDGSGSSGDSDCDGNGFGGGDGSGYGDGRGYSNGRGSGRGQGSGCYGDVNSIEFGLDTVDCGTPEAVILEVHEE